MWEYKIQKNNEIKSGSWDTSLSASKVCNYFENNGWEIIYLNKIEDRKSVV